MIWETLSFTQKVIIFVVVLLVLVAVFSVFLPMVQRVSISDVISEIGRGLF